LVIFVFWVNFEQKSIGLEDRDGKPERVIEKRRLK